MTTVNVPVSVAGDSVAGMLAGSLTDAGVVSWADNGLITHRVRQQRLQSISQAQDPDFERNGKRLVNKSTMQSSNG
jgi:hypothetical protein